MTSAFSNERKVGVSHSRNHVDGTSRDASVSSTARTPCQTGSCPIAPSADVSADTFGPGFGAIIEDRAAEADEFYDAVLPQHLDDEARMIARRAFAMISYMA